MISLRVPVRRDICRWNHHRTSEDTMPLPTSVKLSSIHCRDEADGIGDAEPYLWTIFFKIDGETIKQPPGLPVLTGDAVFRFGPGSHGNLGTKSVDAGDTVQIPPAIGEWHTQLQPIIITKQDGTTISVPGIVGAVAVLMEEDNVSDSGAEQGHQKLNSFVQTEINDFIHGINLLEFIGVDHPEDKLAELIEAMKKKIQDGSAAVVSKAIQDAQGFLSNLWSGLNKDDKIGSVAYTFSQQDIVQHRYSIALNQRWRSEGDWELFGVISAPDQCLAQRVAVNQQKTRIDEINRQIKSLRTQMVRASASVRAALQAEINEFEAELVPLRAELKRLEGLLDRCYLLQSIAVPVTGGVLVNA
jgi:hypothetical protein